MFSPLKFQGRNTGPVCLCSKAGQSTAVFLFSSHSALWQELSLLGLAIHSSFSLQAPHNYTCPGDPHHPCAFWMGRRAKHPSHLLSDPWSPLCSPKAVTGKWLGWFLIAAPSELPPCAEGHGPIFATEPHPYAAALRILRTEAGCRFMLLLCCC